MHGRFLETRVLRAGYHAIRTAWFTRLRTRSSTTILPYSEREAKKLEARANTQEPSETVRHRLSRYGKDRAGRHY